MAGDFNGDGISTIAIFREGIWFLDMDGRQLTFRHQN